VLQTWLDNPLKTVDFKSKFEFRFFEFLPRIAITSTPSGQVAIVWILDPVCRQPITSIHTKRAKFEFLISCWYQTYTDYMLLSCSRYQPPLSDININISNLLSSVVRNTRHRLVYLFQVFYCNWLQVQTLSCVTVILFTLPDLLKLN
jgi:hypothetical protein